MQTGRIVQRGLVVVGALAASVACCGCGTAGVAYDQGTAAAARPCITLYVANDNWEDVRISILRDGLHLPVGTVGSLESRSFRIPLSRLGSDCSVCLRIHAVLSDTYFATVPVLVEPGQTVEARIAGRLHQTSVVVRF